MEVSNSILSFVLERTIMRYIKSWTKLTTYRCKCTRCSAICTDSRSSCGDNRTCCAGACGVGSWSSSSITTIRCRRIWKNAHDIQKSRNLFMGSTLSTRHFQRIWFYMYEARIHIIWRFQHVLFCIERVTLLNCRAVILFRDVENCGISSVNGIASIQFSEFRPIPLWLNSRNSVQELDPHIVGWTSNTTRCMWVRAGTDSGTEFRELNEIGIGQNRTESELIPGAKPVPQCWTLRNRMYSQVLSLTWCTCRCSCWSRCACCECDTQCSSKDCQWTYEKCHTQNQENSLSLWCASTMRQK